MYLNIWRSMVTCTYSQMTKYKVTFFTSLFNIIVKIVAMAMVWKSVYAQNIVEFQLTLKQMLIYSTMSIALSQCLTWWDGPHYYALESIQSGTVILDILKPISFPLQLLLRGSSEFVLNIFVYTIPTILAGIALLQINFSTHVINIFLLFIALICSYLILFEFQLILTFISIRTLELNGIIHFFHAIVMLLSCQIIPIGMYPAFIQNIINTLPFKYVFYFPLSILTSDIPFDKKIFISTLVSEVLWMIIIGIICALMWKKNKRIICIQGG